MPMKTEVRTPDRARPGSARPDSAGPGSAAARVTARRGSGQTAGSGAETGTDSRQPVGPARPVSPGRPAGPARPGRPVRPGGPPRPSQQGPAGDPERLAVRTAAESSRSPRRTSFVLLVLGLLGGGMICLLVINTTLAAAWIQINKLQQGNAAQTQRAQALRQQVASERSDSVLYHEAVRLGMRPEQVPAFVDLRTHKMEVGQNARSGGLAGPGLTP